MVLIAVLSPTTRNVGNSLDGRTREPTKTHATMEVAAVFFRGSSTWELKRPLPKTDLEDEQNRHGMKKIPLLQGTQRESCKKMSLFFRRFWFKEPRHSKTNSPKKGIPLSPHASKALLCLKLGFLKIYLPLCTSAMYGIYIRGATAFVFFITVCIVGIVTTCVQVHLGAIPR